MTSKRDPTFVKVVFHPRCWSLRRRTSAQCGLGARVMLVRPQLRKGILWPISLAKVRVIDWNCDLSIVFHCKFEKLLWFTSLMYWFVEERLSRGMDRSNAVCVSPNVSFLTKSQYKNIVWLPSLTSTGQCPKFFTTVSSEIFCWSSWNLPSTVLFDFRRCSAFWQSMIVINPRKFFQILRDCLDHQTMFFHITMIFYAKFLRRFMNFPRNVCWLTWCVFVLLEAWRWNFFLAVSSSTFHDRIHDIINGWITTGLYVTYFWCTKFHCWSFSKLPLHSHWDNPWSSAWKNLVSRMN